MRIAGHTSPSTTRIYDRSGDRLTLEEIEQIERVQIGKKQEFKYRELSLPKKRALCPQDVPAVPPYDHPQRVDLAKLPRGLRNSAWEAG